MVAPGIKRVFAATWFKIKFLFFFFINLAFVTWLWLQLMNVKTQLIMLSNHLDVNVCLTYSGVSARDQESRLLNPYSSCSRLTSLLLRPL